MLKPKKKKRVLKTKSSSYRYLSSAGSPETGAKLSKNKDNFKKVVTKTKKGTTKKKVKTRKSPQFRKRATLIS